MHWLDNCSAGSKSMLIIQKATENNKTETNSVKPSKNQSRPCTLQRSLIETFLFTFCAIGAWRFSLYRFGLCGNDLFAQLRSCEQKGAFSIPSQWRVFSIPTMKSLKIWKKPSVWVGRQHKHLNHIESFAVSDTLGKIDWIWLRLLGSIHAIDIQWGRFAVKIAGMEGSENILKSLVMHWRRHGPRRPEIKDAGTKNWMMRLYLLRRGSKSKGRNANYWR